MFRRATFLFLLIVIPTARIQAQQDDKKKKPDPIQEGLKALQHPDAKIRYRAAQTLADLGPVAKFAAPELREALKDQNGVVRVKVAEALWKVDKTSPDLLLPVLGRALLDKDFGVRAAAPPVIAMLGAHARSAVPALVDALKDKELDVKLATIVALGELGKVAKDSAAPLLAMSTDKDFVLLEPFVGSSLGSLGPDAIPVLSKALADKSDDRARVAAYALGTMGPSAAPATKALVKALDHKDAALRQLAARALGKIGSSATTSMAKLETMLSDQAPSVRVEAALATWLISKENKHVGILIKALFGEAASVRDAACQALALMKADAKDAVDPLGKLLDDKDLRIRAITALGEIGPPASKTLPSVKKLMADTDAETQLHAAFAMWQISGDAKESLAVIEKTLATVAHYSQSIVLLGEMRGAAAPLLPTLVALYREEDVPADRRALAEAIKKIDPQLAKKIGIQ